MIMMSWDPGSAPLSGGRWKRAEVGDIILLFYGFVMSLVSTLELIRLSL